MGVKEAFRAMSAQQQGPQHHRPGSDGVRGASWHLGPAPRLAVLLPVVFTATVVTQPNRVDAGRGDTRKTPAAIADVSSLEVDSISGVMHEPVTLRFTVPISVGRAEEYVVSWGDGLQKATRIPGAEGTYWPADAEVPTHYEYTREHTYSAASEYLVTISYYDASRTVQQETTTATISPPGPEELTAAFEVEKLVVDPETGALEWEAIDNISEDHPIEHGLHIRLNATSSTGAAHYRWRRDGSLFGMDAIEENVYEGPDDIDDEPAEITVSLTVYDAAVENTATISKTIYVNRTMRFLDVLPRAVLLE